MITCIKCGTIVPDGSAECPKCGVVLAKARLSRSPLAQGPTTDYGPSAGPESPVPPPPALAPPPLPPVPAPAPSSLRSVPGQWPSSLDQDPPPPEPVPMLIGARKWMVLLLYTSYVNVALFWVFALSLILSSPTNLPRVALGLLYVANGALALPFLEPFRRACVAIRDLASADPQRCVSAFVLEHCTIYRRMGIFLCIVFGLTLLALVAILLLALSRRH